MLRQLRIENLVLARSVLLEFVPGLNLITGETGAGKSLIVGAIELALGGRGDANLVRQGEERALVEAVLELKERPDVLERLQRAGFDAPGHELLARREVGALPQGRNSPQRAPHGLYAELLSGTAFTAPRALNRRTWMYRRQPSVVSGAYAKYEQPLWTSGAAGGVDVSPDPLRWNPFPIPAAPLDFVDGVRTVVANGDVQAQSGMAALVYTANRAMTQRVLVNADGEMLFVPQQGRLRIATELGRLEDALAGGLERVDRSLQIGDAEGAVGEPGLVHDAGARRRASLD